MQYKVTHYDDSVSEHDTLDQAINEVAKRLEPWREGTDFVSRQNYTEAEIAEAGLYVFVANEHGQDTDAESYIEVVK